jgi:hypothetical protein
MGYALSIASFSKQGLLLEQQLDGRYFDFEVNATGPCRAKRYFRFSP